LSNEYGFKAGDVGLGGGRPWAFGKFLDPDLAFKLRRRVGNGFGRSAWLGFWRGNFDAEFVRDIEVIEPGLEPHSVRESFFVTFEERENGSGGGAKGGEIDNVFALEFFLDIREEFFDFLAVGVFQDAKSVVIEIFFGPLLGGLEEVVESQRIGLGGKVEGKI